MNKPRTFNPAGAVFKPGVPRLSRRQGHGSDLLPHELVRTTDAEAHAAAAIHNGTGSVRPTWGDQ